MQESNPSMQSGFVTSALIAKDSFVINEEGMNPDVVEFFRLLKLELPRFLPEGFLESDQYQTLLQTGKVSQVGTDEVCRPIYVNLQAAVEKTLSLLVDKKLVKADQLIHITHTPAPGTPFCYTEADKDIDPQILADRSRFETVTKRHQIIMWLLENGATMATVYPENGLSERSAAGQERLRSLVGKYKNLLNFPVSEDRLPSLPADQSGATCLLMNKGEVVFTFSIGAYQALNIAANAEKQWEFYLGTPEKPLVAEMLTKRYSIFRQAGLVEQLSLPDISLPQTPGY